MSDSDWKKFGELSFRYGLAPAWVIQKSFNQTHNITKDNLTTQEVYAPPNYLYVAPGIPTPEQQLFVTPNPNVIYASSHISLIKTEENPNPVVLLHPQPHPHGQYAVWQFMDAFTNDVKYIGSTQTVKSDPVLPIDDNGKSIPYCLVGPQGGSVPEGYTKIEFETENIWLVVRYFVTPDTVEEVREALVKSTVYPDGHYIPVNPPWDYKEDQPPKYAMDIVTPWKPTNPETDPLTFYYQLNQWLNANNWGPIDADQQAFLEQHGLGPNLNTNWDEKLASSTDQSDVLNGAHEESIKIDAAVPFNTTPIRGWHYSIKPEMGNYGKNLFLRSLIARVGLGANILSQCVYPANYGPITSLFDMSKYWYSFTIPGSWLVGASSEDLPYVKPGFWSITVYELKSGRLPYTYQNKTPTIYQPNMEIKTNGEGNAEFIISPTPAPLPVGVNWLPGPTTKNESQVFYLIMRIYAPKPLAYNPPESDILNPYLAPIVIPIEPLT